MLRLRRDVVDLRGDELLLSVVEVDESRRELRGVDLQLRLEPTPDVAAAHKSGEDGIRGRSRERGKLVGEVTERRCGKRHRRRIVHLQPLRAECTLYLGKSLGVCEAERGKRLVRLYGREERRNFRGFARRGSRDGDLRHLELWSGRDIGNELRHGKSRLLEDYVHHRKRIENAGDYGFLDAGKLHRLRELILESRNAIALPAQLKSGKVPRLQLRELLPALDLDVCKIAREYRADLLGNIRKGKRVRAEDAADVCKFGGDVKATLPAAGLAERKQFVGASRDVWSGKVDEMRGSPDERRDEPRGEAPCERVTKTAAALSSRNDDENVRKRLYASCVRPRPRGEKVGNCVDCLPPRVKGLGSSHASSS